MSSLTLESAQTSLAASFLGLFHVRLLFRETPHDACDVEFGETRSP